MASVKRLTVTFAYRKGFKHSYSSVETSLSEEITLDPGDDPKKVRAEALKRLSREAVKDVAAFKSKHDKPE